MRNRERITPLPCHRQWGNRDLKQQTVQAHLQYLNPNAVKMQYAVRVLAARYGLSLNRARVVASLAGIGGV
jgi:hypothetical protein